MILGDPQTAAVPRTTLDDLFRRAATRHPDAIALADPANREGFSEGLPRKLTYAETDRAVSAIASRLHELGLKRDSVIGIQLPNTVESVITVLGVLRANMIAAPLPLLWRRADATGALGRLGAKAIVTASRIGEFDACTTAMQVATDVFTIRHVCAFGSNPPDGVISLGTIFDEPDCHSPPELQLEGNPAAHVAMVTFDVSPDGSVAVARNHAELIAGGLAALLESGMEPDASMLGCCVTGSFAGFALTVVPWLLSGGTLSLHHGFDAQAFAVQCREDRCDTLVVPGALLPHLVAAGLLSHTELKRLLAVWRAPERLIASPAWAHPAVDLTDILVFGETGLIGSRRGAGGRPVPLGSGQAEAPRGGANAVHIADIARTETGTLALRGPMVARHSFPPGAEQMGLPQLKADAGGFVDTGYACRIDRMTDTVTITAPPPGIVSVGGYRFVLSELEALVARANGGAFITALPDALAGHRLAGISGSQGDIRAALAGNGVNPLIADAFRAA